MKDADRQGWLIVGGTSGIGAAIADAASAAGAVVAVASRHQAGPHPWFRCDVTDEDEVDTLFDALDDEGHRVDVIVNCAGMPHDALLVSTSLADWDRVLATNLRGPMLVCRRGVEEQLSLGVGPS